VNVTLSIAPTTVVRTLGTIVVALTVASLAHSVSWYGFGVDYLDFGWRFDVMAEANIPTWYSSVALLICAALALAVASAERQRGGESVRHWRGISALLLLLSLDETAGLHEWTGDALGGLARPGYFAYAWTLAGLTAVAIVGLVYRRFVLSLPARTRASFLLASGLFAGGALGMEMVNANYSSYFGGQNLIYALMTAVEELAEMTGVLVFVRALFEHLQRVQSVERVSVAFAQPT